MSDDKQTNPDKLAIYNIMRDQGNRSFMWDHLQSCMLFESTFEPDPIKHAYNAGKRDSALMIERKMKEFEPDLYLKMIKENVDG